MLFRSIAPMGLVGVKALVTGKSVLVVEPNAYRLPLASVRMERTSSEDVPPIAAAYRIWSPVELVLMTKMSLSPRGPKVWVTPAKAEALTPGQVNVAGRVYRDGFHRHARAQDGEGFRDVGGGRNHLRKQADGRKNGRKKKSRETHSGS